MNDNVLAKWKSKQWYLAQVTRVWRGRYDVYFLDGQTKTGLHPTEVREFKSANPPPKRRDMLGQTFYDSGDHDLAAGEWRVRRLVRNEYVCTRLTGGGPNAKNMENFDIGHVLRCVQSRVQTKRELGPAARGLL